MKVSIYSMINPRMEILHLEEWIRHNLNFGFDNIFLYNHGFICNDDRGSGQKIWQKKPYIDYADHLSDNDITEMLNELVSKYSEVTQIDWTPMGGCDRDRTWQCQHRGYINCVKNNKSDWWTCIDPDEYFYSDTHTDIKDFLRQKKGAIGISQVLFEYRKPNKRVVDLALSKGELNVLTKVPKQGLTKTLIQSHSIKEFHNHRPISDISNDFVLDKNELCYFHYKTNVSEDCSQPNYNVNTKMKAFSHKIKNKKGNEQYK